MTEYPANNPKQTPPVTQDGVRKNPLEQVTTGKVMIKKPSHTQRLKQAFTREDGRNVAQHALTDVILPGAKNMAFDAATEMLGQILGVNISFGARNGGGMKNYNGMSGSSLASKVNYSGTRPGYLVDPRDRQPERRAPQAQTRGNVSVSDIILASRVEGDEVIARMAGLCREYGQASLADLFDLVAVTGQYTDEKFGWVSMEGARTHRTRDGFMLDIPNMVQLD